MQWQRLKDNLSGRVFRAGVASMFLALVACPKSAIQRVEIPRVPQARGVTVYLPKVEKRFDLDDSFAQNVLVAVTNALRDAGFTVSATREAAEIRGTLLILQEGWQLTLTPAAAHAGELESSVPFTHGVPLDWEPERCSAAASLLVRELVTDPRTEPTLAALKSPPPAPAPVTPADSTPAPTPPAARPAAKNKGIVAVLPVDSTSADLDQATKRAFEEVLRTVAGDALSEHGYTVLTGETTLAVLADNNIDPGRACEASCALAAARELKARIFLSGVITKTEGDFLAFIRLFDSASGRQLASVQLEGDSVKALRRAFITKADAFFRKSMSELE